MQARMARNCAMIESGEGGVDNEAQYTWGVVWADVDEDGDQDLYVANDFDITNRYYRNDGSVTAPMFVLVADSLKDAAGEPIFSDRQNIPQVTDMPVALSSTRAVSEISTNLCPPPDAASGLSGSIGSLR